MPTLAISQEMLDTRQAEARVVILATMLWPDNEKARIAAIHAGKAAFINAVRKATHKPDDVLSLDSETLDWLVNAQPVNSLDGGAVRVRSGDIAGRILASCLGEHATGSPIGLQTAKMDVERKLGLAGPSRGTDPNAKKVSTVIEDAWKTFKPVSHLWAVNLMAAVHNVDTAEFLARAESIRLQAESLTTKYSKDAVLPAGIAWRAPDGLTLPKGRVRFRRTT